MLRIAIIGSGPAGCFTADELLRSGRAMAITVYERRALPGGLIRYGVAPDHVHTRRLLRLLDRTLAHPAVTFRPGIALGHELALEDVRSAHDAVVIATGAERDRALGIPGEHLTGIHPSLAFAQWVNGAPEREDAHVDLAHETAVVIGHGNVALDLVRMLCHDEATLAATDTAPAARAALARSRVRRIHVIGRRGPVQASFGANELEEVGTLPEVDLRVNHVDLALDAADEEELGQPAAGRQRAVLQTLRVFADRKQPAAPRITVSFDFFRIPMAFTGADRVEALQLAPARMQGPAGQRVAAPCGPTKSLRCGMALIAIGHRSVALPGLPFDDVRGVIPARDHRVEGMSGVYATGWICRGATGLIGHNRRDAMETAEAILSDF